MLSAFFVNFCILVTFTSVGSMTHTGQETGHTQRRLLRYLISVTAGIVLVGYGVPIAEGVRVDFRSVPVLLAGLFGGPGPALAVALPVALYRWWLGGAGAPSGMLSVFLVALLAGALHTRFAHNRITWRDAWVPFGIFALANLSLMFVPGTGLTLLRTAAPAVTLLQGLATLVAFVVIGLRFTSVGRTSTLKDIAYLDGLTGLNNRRRFDLDLPLLGAEAGTFLLLLDLDHFKHLNDTYGHPFGDQVLEALARLLQDGVRGSDRVYRLGGEEFGILLRNTTPRGAQDVAERLRQGVRAHLGGRVGQPGQLITVSGGLTACHPQPEGAVRRADALLYGAKRAGRDRIAAAA